MVVNSSGVCLSQRRETKMCLIKPFLDLSAGILRLTYPGKLYAHIKLFPQLVVTVVTNPCGHAKSFY